MKYYYLFTLFLLPLSLKAQAPVLSQGEPAKEITTLKMPSKPKSLFTPKRFAAQLISIASVTVIGCILVLAMGNEASLWSSQPNYWIKPLVGWNKTVFTIHSLLSAVISFYSFLSIYEWLAATTQSVWKKLGVGALAFIISSLVMPMSAHWIDKDGIYSSNKGMLNNLEIIFMIWFGGGIVQPLIGFGIYKMLDYSLLSDKEGLEPKVVV